MKRHTSYLMTGITEGRKRRRWTNVPNNVQGIIQTGLNYGVLILDVVCTCCNHLDTYTYFFTLDDGDYVCTEWMKPRAIGTDIVIMLPSAKGRFSSKLTSVAGFDDSYILRILVHTMTTGDDDDDADNNTIDLIFARIHCKILLRTAFRNLYFRAFRRSFAPEQPQGIKARMQYAEDYA